MKNLIKTFVLSAVSFGILMSIAFWVIFDLTTGIIAGILAGISFALIITIFAYIQTRKFELIKQELSRDYEIIYDGGANHFRGKEAVGGWLFLTSTELIFKSHGFNIQNQKTIIPLNNILEVTKVNTLGIVPNGLMIRTNNKSERFVLHGRGVWIQKIKQARSMNL